MNTQNDVTKVHEEKETLSVDINIPGHDPRTTTPLFLNTKKLLHERDGAQCWLCGCTAEESGEPLESHHYPIERSLADMIDWNLFRLIVWKVNGEVMPRRLTETVSTLPIPIHLLMTKQSMA